MANPPISIPPFSNVPAPGSPIRSDWAQQITHYVVDTPGMVRRNGDTMTGTLLSGANPVTSGNPGILIDPTGQIISTAGNTAVDAPSIALYRAFNAANTAQRFMQFTRGLPAGPTSVGSIAIASTSTVVYNTTSDPRLKRPVGDVTDALARIRHLGAAAFRGRWVQDEVEGVGVEWDMLSSHDVEDVASYAVMGERDAVDDAGNIEPQQVDYSKLIPLLCAAIDELAAALDEALNR